MDIEHKLQNHKRQAFKWLILAALSPVIAWVLFFAAMILLNLGQNVWGPQFVDSFVYSSLADSAFLFAIICGPLGSVVFLGVAISNFVSWIKQRKTEQFNTEPIMTPHNNRHLYNGLIRALICLFVTPFLTFSFAELFGTIAFFLTLGAGVTAAAVFLILGVYWHFSKV